MRPLLLSLVLVGCSQPPLPEDDFDEELERQRTNVLSDSCFRDTADTSNCEWTEHVYAPDELPMLEGGSDETVLVVDTLPRLTTAMFRYRARVRGYYRPTSDGALVAANFTWRLPTTLHTALEKLRRPFAIPAERFAPLSRAVNDTYGTLVFDDLTHGGFVFNVLVEPSPRHSFVFVDSVDFRTFASAHFCSLVDDGSVEVAMRANAERLANDLRALMSRMNVRYVNYSAGWSLPVMRETWASSCSTPVPGDDVLRRRLATFEPIARVLFATDGVVAAHAADEGPDALDFPYDQRTDAYPNRLRVGVFQSLDSGLPATGGTSGDDAWPGPQSADVWVNSGVLRKRPFPYNATPMLGIDGFGTSIAPLTSTTTSWLTPLVLARFVHLRESRFASEPFDAKKLIDAVTPTTCPEIADQRCRFQDPLLHGQTDAMRIGLRSVKYNESP